MQPAKNCKDIGLCRARLNTAVTCLAAVPDETCLGSKRNMHSARIVSLTRQPRRFASPPNDSFGSKADISCLGR
jgi:hypothetical protein